MKKAIIFDLNGVFIKSPYLSERFEKDYGVDPEEFLPALAEIMDKVRRPNAPKVYELWKPYLEKWRIAMSEGEFLDYWFGAEKENSLLINIGKELKEKGYRLFVLSNNLKERSEFYDSKFSFLMEIFEKVYFSWQTGFVKPDERAIIKVLEDNNLKPEECIYFDDSEKNLKVAREVGVESHVFSNESINFLKELPLII